MAFQCANLIKHHKTVKCIRAHKILFSFVIFSYKGELKDSFLLSHLIKFDVLKHFQIEATRLSKNLHHETITKNSNEQ